MPHKLGDNLINFENYLKLEKHFKVNNHKF